MVQSLPHAFKKQISLQVSWKGGGGAPCIPYPWIRPWNGSCILNSYTFTFVASIDSVVYCFYSYSWLRRDHQGSIQLGPRKSLVLEAMLVAAHHIINVFKTNLKSRLVEKFFFVHSMHCWPHWPNGSVWFIMHITNALYGSMLELCCCVVAYSSSEAQL